MGACLAPKTAFVREFDVSTDHRRFKFISSQINTSSVDQASTVAKSLFPKKVRCVCKIFILSPASLKSTIKRVVRAFLSAKTAFASRLEVSSKSRYLTGVPNSRSEESIKYINDLCTRIERDVTTLSAGR